jgi:hypothetical protein
MSLPFDRFRLGARWTGERDISSWARATDRLDGWARLDLTARLGVHLITSRRARTRTHAVGFDWYP